MRARISASLLTQDLDSILDRVRRKRDSFLIEKNGETVAALEPVPDTTTWSDLADALRSIPHPDPAFADDLEEIQQSQPKAPTHVWDN